MAENSTTSALTTIINALQALTSEERHRTVDAAMLFLGENSASTQRKPPKPAQVEIDAAYPPAVSEWMGKHGHEWSRLGA